MSFVPVWSVTPATKAIEKWSKTGLVTSRTLRWQSCSTELLLIPVLAKVT